MPVFGKNRRLVPGWGQTSANGTFNNILQQVDVPVWDQEKCRQTFQKYGVDITKDQMCAGYDEGGKDACQVGVAPDYPMPHDGFH